MNTSRSVQVLRSARDIAVCFERRARVPRLGNERVRGSLHLAGQQFI